MKGRLVIFKELRDIGDSFLCRKVRFHVVLTETRQVPSSLSFVERSGQCESPAGQGTTAQVFSILEIGRQTA